MRFTAFMASCVPTWSGKGAHKGEVKLQAGESGFTENG
jgi:hypothetical protein